MVDSPTTKGLVLRRAFLYDLSLWFLSRGREGEMREKAPRLAPLSDSDWLSMSDLACWLNSIGKRRRAHPY
jgi:hypothetical protein